MISAKYTNPRLVQLSRKCLTITRVWFNFLVNDSICHVICLIFALIDLTFHVISLTMQRIGSNVVTLNHNIIYLYMYSVVRE